MIRHCLSVAAATVLVHVAPLSAQLGSYNPEPGPRASVVIRNARIVPVRGDVIANGSIVIADGRIQAIGANVTTPAGAQVIDASGLSVYPGMMDAGTTMGLAEIEQGADATLDQPPSQQAMRRIRSRLPRILAVHLKRRVGFLGQIHQLRNGSLHPVRHLVLRNASLNLRIAEHLAAHPVQ